MKFYGAGALASVLAVKKNYILIPRLRQITNGMRLFHPVSGRSVCVAVVFELPLQSCRGAGVEVGSSDRLLNLRYRLVTGV